LEHHFPFARDLHLIDDTAHKRLTLAVVEVKRMLAALARKVETECLAS
jgi:hypothetical protein